MARTGNTAHLCLLTVAAKDGSELPKRSLDRAMENLQELIRQNLRKGDVASPVQRLAICDPLAQGQP